VNLVVGGKEEELVVAVEELGNGDGTADGEGELVLVIDGLADRDRGDDAVDQFLFSCRDGGETPGVEDAVLRTKSATVP
jgi:hypothetical protein